MIDWSQIRQLEADIGADDFAEVVNLFLMEVDEAVEALAENPPQDAAGMAAALHFLKGSAFNLGFQTFGEICGQGEVACNRGALESVSVPTIVGLYQASKTEFTKDAADHCSFSAIGV